MKAYLVALFLTLLASTAMAGPTTVEVTEIPDGFYAIPLTQVSWADQTKEWAKAQAACGGGTPVFVDWRRENGILVHIAECR